MKILNFGSCNIDIVCGVDHVVRPGETVSANSVEHFVGGKGLNQSVALANAGVEIYHAGFIGADGEILRSFMKNAGVDTKYLRVTDGKSGQAIIQVDKNGENAIFLYKGANHEITTEYIDSVLSDFSEGDFLVVQNEINNIGYIIDKAYERGMKIFFNPAPFNESAANVDLSKLYFIIPNEIECSGYCGSENYKAFSDLIKEKYPNLSAVITLGKNGCVYIDKNNEIRQNVFEVKPVDTTAAGDTFVGYFVAETSRGKLPCEAIRTACAAAALTVSRKGAAPSIPKYDEVAEFINKNEKRRF